MPGISSHHLVLGGHELCKVERTSSELFESPTLHLLVVDRSLGVGKHRHGDLLGVIEINWHLTAKHRLINRMLVQILISLVSSGERHG